MGLASIRAYGNKKQRSETGWQLQHHYARGAHLEKSITRARMGKTTLTNLIKLIEILRKIIFKFIIRIFALIPNEIFCVFGEVWHT